MDVHVTARRTTALEEASPSAGGAGWIRAFSWKRGSLRARMSPHTFKHRTQRVLTRERVYGGQTHNLRMLGWLGRCD